MPVKQSLESAGYEVSICTFEAGEAHKRAETYVAILGLWPSTSFRAPT